jgi:hypothetical protein
MIETSNFIFDRIQPMQDPVSENIPKEKLLAMIRDLSVPTLT